MSVINEMVKISKCCRTKKGYCVNCEAFQGFEAKDFIDPKNALPTLCCWSDHRAIDPITNQIIKYQHTNACLKYQKERGIKE